jgi:hypothetical protein
MNTTPNTVKGRSGAGVRWRALAGLALAAAVLTGGTGVASASITSAKTVKVLGSNWN